MSPNQYQTSNYSLFTILQNRIVMIFGVKLSNRDYRVERGIAVVALLNVLDAVSTYFALSLSVASEQNPIAAIIFNEMGMITGIIGLKVFALGLLGLGYVAYTNSNQRWFRFSFKANIVFAIFLYLSVVVSNTIVVLTRL